jgi:hypothetical protein
VYPENEELGIDDIPFQMVGGLSEQGKLWFLDEGKQLGASLLFIIIYYYLLLLFIYYYLLLFIKGELKLIHLDPGDVAVLDGRTVHAGAGYIDAVNFRLHAYFDSRRVKHDNQSQEYLRFIMTQPIIRELKENEWTEDEFRANVNKKLFEESFPLHSLDEFYEYVGELDVNRRRARGRRDEDETRTQDDIMASFLAKMQVKMLF